MVVYQHMKPLHAACKILALFIMQHLYQDNQSSRHPLVEGREHSLKVLVFARLIPLTSVMNAMSGRSGQSAWMFTAGCTERY